LIVAPAWAFFWRLSVSPGLSGSLAGGSFLFYFPPDQTLRGSLFFLFTRFPQFPGSVAGSFLLAITFLLGRLLLYIPFAGLGRDCTTSWFGRVPGAVVVLLGISAWSRIRSLSRAKCALSPLSPSASCSSTSGCTLSPHPAVDFDVWWSVFPNRSRRARNACPTTRSSSWRSCAGSQRTRWLRSSMTEEFGTTR